MERQGHPSLYAIRTLHNTITSQLRRRANIAWDRGISKNLKNLARELHCPVIALSQLSGSPAQRTPPIPILSDLRDSGAISKRGNELVYESIS
jgi:replicative DNA helicase